MQGKYRRRHPAKLRTEAAPPFQHPGSYTGISLADWVQMGTCMCFTMTRLLLTPHPTWSASLSLCPHLAKYTLFPRYTFLAHQIPGYSRLRAL